MKKHIKYLLLGIGIALLIGMPWIVVQLFAGMSGGGTSSSSAPEGTAVLSTGETGGAKFLREDGDGTSSWQAAGDMALASTQTVTATKTFNSGKLVATTPSLTTPTITGTATFNGDINSTGTVTADKFVGTGTGQSSLPEGIIVNEDGGSALTSDFRVETNTETDMIRTSAVADTMTLGGTTNGIMITKGGAIDFLGTAIGNEIGGSLKEINLTIISPSNTYLVAGSSVCIITKLTKAITITNIEATLDATTNELTGDLKYADAFIGLANPVLINDIDTTSGARSDSSITSGSVAAGKSIFLFFDAQPHNDIKQLAITISGYYQ